MFTFFPTATTSVATVLANGNVVFNTAGDGYWSTAVKPVSIVDIQLSAFNKKYGELRVYFNSADWDNDTDGLIYSDMGFKQHLLQFLADNDIDYRSVSYSEQGMQGDDYVSFDVEKDFIKTWNAKFIS